MDLSLKPSDFSTEWNLSMCLKKQKNNKTVILSAETAMIDGRSGW